jgi:hypothetical protein
LDPAPPGIRIKGVGGYMDITHIGTVVLPVRVKVPNTNQVIEKEFTINRVLYAEGLQFNIVSIRALTLDSSGNPTDVAFSFYGEQAYVLRESTDAIIAEASCRETDLYTLNLQQSPQIGVARVEYVATAIESTVSMITWHRRLGHLKEARLQRLLTTVGVPIPKEPLGKCEACLKAGLKYSNSRTPARRADAPFRRIFLDLTGAMTLIDEKGHKRKVYGLLITDDWTRYRWLKILDSKGEVKKALKAFIIYVRNQFQKEVGAMRNDNGGEFKNKDMDKLREEVGLEYEPTVPYGQQQNGVSERHMGVIGDSARAVMFQSNLPEVCFPEILVSVVYLSNLSPTSANQDQTPHERLFNEPPPVNHIRVLGCECWVPVPRPAVGLPKMDSRGERCYLLGYTGRPTENYYRVWNVDQERVLRVRAVKFYEDEFSPAPPIPYTASLQGYLSRSGTTCREGEPTILAQQSVLYPLLVTVDGKVNRDLAVTREGPEVRERIEAQKRRIDFTDFAKIQEQIALLCALEENQEKDLLTLITEAHPETNEPRSYQAATTGPDSKLWGESMDDECKSIKENKVWDVVDGTQIKEQGKGVLSGKYVYKIKTDASGKPIRWKSRWVVRGFEQEEGIDFNETFASVVKPMSYKALFVLACVMGWHIEQMDVKTAFLYGAIDAEVYVQLPPNLVARYPVGSVCKLKKALYGLKQAPRIWYETLKEALGRIGFVSLLEDYSVFGNKEMGVIIAVYVDDLLILGKDMEEIGRLKNNLAELFQMVDLGSASYYLGIRVSREWTGKGRWSKIKLSQGAYARRVVKQFGGKVANAEILATPMETNAVLVSNERTADRATCRWYQALIGSLMYLMLCTRPDLAYAVSQLSRFSANPSQHHVNAGLRVIRYLKGTTNLGLVIDSSAKREGLKGYADANWAREEGRRSTGGYVFLLYGTAISWSSKRQATVALSSCEAEYIAESEAAKEAIWLRRLLASLSSTAAGGYQGPRKVLILGDNEGALSLAKNPLFHSRTKHIDTRYHFVREKVQEGLVEMGWVPTKMNIADGMTKPLSGQAFQSFRHGIGLVEVKEEEEPVRKKSKAWKKKGKKGVTTAADRVANIQIEEGH